MTIDEMKWMTTLFDTGNMSQAAKALFVSQPALSQCVKRIEGQLGFPLFERSNKGLVPTEKGLLFARTAASITDSYQQFLAQAELLDCTELHHISIGMGPYLSACCSADLIRQLRNAYPHIQISVQEGSPDGFLDGLFKNRLQLAITLGPLSFDGIKVRPFGQGKLVIFLKKGSPVAQHVYIEDGRRYLDPRFLADEPLALTTPGQMTRLLTNKLLQEAGIDPPIQQESRHIATLYRYAQEGVASSIAPLSFAEVEKDGKHNLICEIPPGYQNASVFYCTLAMPKVDKIIPKGVYQIIQDVVENCGTLANTGMTLGYEMIETH